MLGIATRGFYGHVILLLNLLVLIVLLLSGNSNTNNLIITNSGAGGQLGLKFGVETTHKTTFFLGIYTNIFGGILR